MTDPLYPARALLPEARRQRARIREYAALLRRFRAAPTPGQVPRRLLTLARKLRDLREQLNQSFASCDSCGSCAAHRPLPSGRWPGGHCCSGPTTAVFSDAEVVALRLAGTRFRDLRSPLEAGYGCVFRGRRGCTLAAQDRPSLCVRYACRELETELGRRGEIQHFRELADELAELHRRFENELERYLWEQEASEAEAAFDPR